MYGFVLLISALSLCQFSCCVATAFFEALQYHQGPGKQFVARKLFHAWLASASIADIIITVVLVCKLSSIRIRLGVKATDDKIKKILYTIVPAGAATAICQILIWVLQGTFPGVAYYQFLIFSLSKIYSNSVILSLNLRDNKQQQISVDFNGVTSGHSFGNGIGYTTFDMTNDMHRQSSQPGHTEDEKSEEGGINHVQGNGMQVRVDKDKVEFNFCPSSFSSGTTIKQGPMPIPTPPPVRPHENGFYSRSNSRSKSSLQSTSSVALGNPLGRIGQLNAAQQSEHFDFMSDSLCFPSNVRTTTTTTKSSPPPPLPKMPPPPVTPGTSVLSQASYSPKSSTHRPVNPPPVFPISPKTDKITTDGNKSNRNAT